jgi:hypothetical protein
MSGCGSFNVNPNNEKDNTKHDNNEGETKKDNAKKDNEKNKFNFNWNEPMKSWIERTDNTIKYN